MSPEKPLISLSKLKVGYNRHPLFEGFSLEIGQGDFLSIVGSNGSGKTTLIRTILGLLSPVSGQIKRAPGLRFGYVPQKSKTNLSFPLTVEQVVMLGRVKRIGLMRRPDSKDHHAVVQALGAVSIEELRSKYIHTLSGGQYQRMLIARALASEPNVLVLDEPTTGMDIVAEHIFIDLVESLRKRLKLSVIMVTHDLSVAANVSDSLVIINGQDKSVSVGAPQEVLTSKKLTTLFHRPLHVIKNDGRMSFVVGHDEEACEQGDKT